MGEIQQHVHNLGPETLDAMRDMLAALRTGGPTHDPSCVTAQTPYDLGLIPWQFHDPRQKVDVVAYVDDRNQVRHVPTTRATEVPKTWQRVWLEPRG